MSDRTNPRDIHISVFLSYLTTLKIYVPGLSHRGKEEGEVRRGEQQKEEEGKREERTSGKGAGKEER